MSSPLRFEEKIKKNKWYYTKDTEHDVLPIYGIFSCIETTISK
jgi:hypothetical protein